MTPHPIHEPSPASLPRTKLTALPRNSPRIDSALFPASTAKRTISPGSYARAKVRGATSGGGAGAAASAAHEARSAAMLRPSEARGTTTRRSIIERELSMPFGSVFGAIVFGVLGSVLGGRLLGAAEAPQKAKGLCLIVMGLAVALGLLTKRPWA